jgi:alkylation response protein AidB-like acyl-CoA dehydrogenase
MLARHRVAARRDFNVDIALSAGYLAYMPVWCAGSQPQMERFARLFRGHQLAALALTERDHGADLVATETVAKRTPDGWSLTGEKWLINNASLGRIVVVLAKTDVPGKRPGLSLFMVDKDVVDAGSYHYLHKVRLHGTRGMDLCGIGFSDTKLGEDALIGKLGAGLDLTLKAFTVSRTGCAGRSVAAADTALRVTIDFARDRRLYGDTVLAISHAKNQLALAFAQLLLCDSIVIATARGLSVTPSQAAISACVCKYLVPTLCEQIIAESSVILGARFFLREDHWLGIFQKVQRDNQLIGLFDGSTIINLSTIASQLGVLAANRRDANHDESIARVAVVHGLDRALPVFRFGDIELLSRGRNDVIDCLAELPAAVEATREDPTIAGRTFDELVKLARALVAELHRLEEHLQAGFKAGWAARARSAEAIELARRYCIIHGIAVGFHAWVHSRAFIGGEFGKGEWLVLAGGKLLDDLRGVASPEPRVDVVPIGEEMLRLFHTRRAFSIVPYRLADAP